jgi:16S rRNA (cytidine1402-2'-O)-methyltransferase
MGTLYLVATPIGNLQDFSPRGVEVLQSVPKIYAEDTRRTVKLLNNFQIKNSLESYFEGNEAKRIPKILAELKSFDIALVSDAGTPLISDPGFKLVRDAIAQGHKVTSIPGANAAILALSISGLPTDRFTFLGFLPKKDSARQKVLEEVRDLRSTLVIYESPFRVKETLQSLLTVLGDRQASVSRELTKIHEETIRGKLSDLVSKFSAPKGEVTLVVASKDFSAAPPRSGTAEPQSL